MKNAFIIFVLQSALYYGQIFSFDGFVKITEANCGGTHTKFINTSKPKVYAISYSDQTISLFDGEKDLRHYFRYKIKDEKPIIKYLYSYKLKEPKVTTEFTIEKTNEKEYKITEFKNKKRGEAIFEVICKIDETSMDLSNSISADISTHRKAMIHSLLKEEVSTPQNFVIMQQITDYKNGRVFKRNTVQFGTIKLELEVPAKIKFRSF